MVPFGGGWVVGIDDPSARGGGWEPTRVARENPSSEITEGDRERYRPGEDALRVRANRAARENLFHGHGDRSGAVAADRGAVTGVGRLGEGGDRARARDYPGHDDGAHDSGCEPPKVSRE